MGPLFSKNFGSEVATGVTDIYLCLIQTQRNPGLHGEWRPDPIDTSLGKVQLRIDTGKTRPENQLQLKITFQVNGKKIAVLAQTGEGKLFGEKRAEGKQYAQTLIAAVQSALREPLPGKQATPETLDQLRTPKKL